MLVCVGIPTIDGKVCAHTMDSLLAEQLLASRQGVHFLVKCEIGCSLIGAARNKLAGWFMRTKQAERLVFIDSDISWKGGDLTAMIKRDKDVIGGTYRAKQENVKFHIHGVPEPKGDLLKVDGLPGGFLQISRNALDRMEPYVDCYDDPDVIMLRDYFPTGIHGERYYGEDYGFCRLYAECGGTIYLDPDIELKHHDGTRHFTGSPRKWLEELAEGR